MGATTSPNGLRYPVGSDTAAQLAAYFANLAADVQGALPVASATEPAKVAGLVWFNPSTGLTQITDGTTWYAAAGDDSGEQAITPATGFTAVNTPVARRIGKTVILSGAIKQNSGAYGVSTVTIGTLPTGFAPAGTRGKRYPSAGSAGAAASGAEVLMTGGSLTLQAAGNGSAPDTVYLDGICYFLS